MFRNTSRIIPVFVFLFINISFFACTDEDLLDQLLEAEELYNEEMLLEERESGASQDQADESSDEDSVELGKDSDEDGIPDDTDKCNNTAKGDDVDENGCSQSQADSDGDGVTDDVDQCPNTGENEEVDENGCSETQKDTDGDGVKDTNDKCPNTPEGEEVDENGCSETQKDTDGDGVSDDNDDCPDTPEGEYVDESGCSDTQKDSDGDGVTDDKDQCKDTPADTEVNEFGCSDSQTDGDDDGVSNELDECPNTPAGETVDAKGCSVSQKDADKDGVTDDLDQCANTPSGETVDANGCSESQKDADEDGVTDDKDECPNTPSGETVDVNGCSDSQKDSDKDGVSNKLDKCANTPSGATVDSNGCAESQKDADGDGIADSADQCPDTPSGQSVNSTGCSATQRDSDGDGVNDAKDQCANTPSGASVDGNGCSESQKDSDGDGVTDNNDQCPGTSAGENVDNNGCPLPEEDPDTEDPDNSNIVSYGGLEVNTTPCEFSLSELQANETLVINCRIDLQGQTVNLPSNVRLEYNKGEIINGKLDFSGGFIDGRLLNSSLEIFGNAQLINPTFTFYTKRWSIEEGEVSDQVAINNLNYLKSAIAQFDELKGNVFEIDDIDAFFGVAHGEGQKDPDTSILIPTNTHFKMGNRCVLRVQPNGKTGYSLLFVNNSQNVTISGGTLIGDRYEHNYSESGSHEWGHLIRLRGVRNSNVDGVKIKDATGDGIYVNSSRIRNQDGSMQSGATETYNVTIKNCIVDGSRRNNISVVDGRNIFIEYNLIKNSGSGVPDQGFYSSNGVSPRSGIDIEPKKKNAPDNNSLYDTQLAEDVHIRYNTFEDNFAADVLMYNGEKAYAYGNLFSGTVSTSYGYNNKIYDNTFINGGDKMKAINIEPEYWADGRHRITDWEVYNNRIEGYQFGIVLGGKGHYVHNNEFIDNTRGVILLDADSIVLDNNNISSSREGSYGYYSFTYENEVVNTTIKNGQVNVEFLGLSLSNTNSRYQGDLTIQNVVFANRIRLEKVNNATVRDSQFPEITIKDCEPILINNTTN